VISTSNKQKKILIIGHRGAKNVAPENTLKSFKKAIELGADFIEFDMHLSKDREIIIMHDEDISTITGKQGLIKNMTLEELKKLDCGEGEKIPTLTEVIEIAKGKIGLQCEVKSQGLTEQLVKSLRANSLIDSSLISSFIFKELVQLRKIEPNLKIGLLLSDRLLSFKAMKKQIQKAIKEKFYSIHPFYKGIKRKIVKFIHENNLKIIAWTVDSKAAMKRLIKIGVDGIITNDISKAKEVINQIQLN